RGRGRVRRMAVPDEAVGAVRVGILAWRLAVSEVRVEEHAPVLAELADVWPAAPADEDVPVGEELGVALEWGEEALRVVVAAHERHALGGHVEPEDEDARQLVHRRRGAVVEHRDRAVRLPSHVVLPGEAGARAQLKGASLPTEPPEDLAGLAAD